MKKIVPLVLAATLVLAGGMIHLGKPVVFDRANIDRFNF